MPNTENTWVLVILAIVVVSSIAGLVVLLALHDGDPTALAGALVGLIGTVVGALLAFLKPGATVPAPAAPAALPSAPPGPAAV